MHPWWGRGFYGGFRGGIGVNVASVNVASSYRNARVAGGVMGVSAADFSAGRFRGISRVGGEQIRSAGLVRGPLPVAPTAANLRYSNRAAVGIPRGSENTRFFSHTQSTPVQRVPFAEQQRAMQQLSRQPVAAASSSGGWRTSAPGSTARGLDRAPAAQSEAGRASGWQRFGEPRAASQRATTNGFSTYNTSRSTGVQPGGSTYRSYSAPAGNYGGNGGSQAIRIAPPVVHERSAPRTETRSSSSGSAGAGHVAHSSGGGGGGGGGHHR